MRTFRYLPLLLALACGPAQEPSSAPQAAPTADKDAPRPQLLVVVTADWDAVSGQLQRYEAQAGAWQAVGEAIPVVVGKNGLAWGRGVADYRDRSGPVKREGDRKSPAGLFRLGAAFGYADPAAATFVKAPYLHVTAATMCIEDGASAHYNRILDEGTVAPDWNSTDHMLRQDDLYEWGMFVEHNAPEAEAGGGSCIFLHVWRQNDSGTAGCTAMDKARMRELLAWIDPAAEPQLLQVPRGAYGDFAQILGLPALP
ncbi:MAG: L,D-transpeptidase family protein [Bacteroidia bacterium]